jgi:ADP-heptose:LPS heptosyltransferase
VQASRSIQARTAIAVSATANLILRAMGSCLWPGSRPEAPERVCVYRIANIGDTACAIPALDVIRRSFPRAHITMVTSPGTRGAPSASDVLAGTGLVDEIAVYYNDEVASLRGRLRFIREMRARRFDLWIELPIVAAYFPTLVRNMIAARAAGPRYALGWRYTGLRLFKRAQSEQIDFPDEVSRLLALLADLGFDSAAAGFPLAISPVERTAVTRMLDESGASRRPFAALAPGAKAEPNRWPAERFGEVGRELVARGFAVAIVGGDSDSKLCADMASAIGASAFSLAGRTTVRESCELLSRAALLVCNDSGVQHLAAAVGTPCVSLFSCRDFRGKWWPHGSQHQVLRKPVECHTCLLDVCPRGNLCINLIDTREVVAAIDKVLASSAAPAAGFAAGRVGL